MESGVQFVTDIEDRRRREYLEQLRRNKRLHESLAKGYDPVATFRCIGWQRSNGSSYAEIASWLNLQGFVSPRGGKFYPMTVKRLFEDPI